MNWRFFFKEGDPGSPSAFRFIIDLRDNWGEAGDTRPSSNSTPGIIHIFNTVYSTGDLEGYLSEEDPPGDGLLQ